MRYLTLVVFLVCLFTYSCGDAQDVPPRLRTGHAGLDAKLDGLVTADTLAISAREADRIPGAVFLDAREPEEYAVSHLPGARPFGYDAMDFSQVDELATDTPLVVYCTVGYRSERAARALRERGFTNVYNLFGSLYAWKLAGLPLEDASGQATNRLHTYNRKWGRFVPDSIGVKVW